MLFQVEVIGIGQEWPVNCVGENFFPTFAGIGTLSCLNRLINSALGVLQTVMITDRLSDLHSDNFPII